MWNKINLSITNTEEKMLAQDTKNKVSSSMLQRLNDGDIEQFNTLGAKTKKLSRRKNRETYNTIITKTK